ncbi:MAG: restriction endonuclease subunit S, partial [Lactobacillus delbrueckii]
MKDEKKAPKLRFKGFTDDWEQCKLGQLFNQEVQYIDPKAENVPLWSLTVADGLVEKTDRYNR